MATIDEQNRQAASSRRAPSRVIPGGVNSGQRRVPGPRGARDRRDERRDLHRRRRAAPTPTTTPPSGRRCSATTTPTSTPPSPRPRAPSA